MSMTYPINLDNRDFNTSSTQILDTRGNSVPITFQVVGEIDMEEYDALLSAIVTMGRLPDGIYDFTISLTDFSTELFH